MPNAASNASVFLAPFELTSPAPPDNLKGRRGVGEAVVVLEGLQRLARGVQANPSVGLHVHVNVKNPTAGGEILTHSGVAAIYAAYALYQLPINGLLSPGRQDNGFARPLLLGECAKADPLQCEENPCGCNVLVYHMMRGLVDRGDEAEWQWHVSLKFFQLNFVPVGSYGTIEFRGHSGTTNSERLARWLQFVLTFTEYFGKGPGKQKMLDRFFSSERSPEAGLADLREAQRSAKVEDLFDELGLTDATDFYANRRWEADDPKCQQNFGGDAELTVKGACYETYVAQRSGSRRTEREVIEEAKMRSQAAIKLHST